MKINKKEALEIARNHVDQIEPDSKWWKYGYGNMKELTYSFYFDYTFLDINTNDLIEPPFAGGATGFLVDKYSRKVSDLGFGEMAELMYQENEINKTFNALMDIKENGGSLNLIKTKYGLSSSQLLELKRYLTGDFFEKEGVLMFIKEIIQQIT